MAAVGRGNSPAQALFGFLQDSPGFAAQVHIQKRLHSGWRRGANPNAAAIRRPVQTFDSRPGRQCEYPVLAGDKRKESNVGRPGNAVLFGHGERETVRRERPVLQIPFRTLNSRDWFFLSRGWVKSKERQMIVSEFAKDTNGGRGASALKIIDARFLQNQFGSPARDGEAHEPDAVLHVARIGIEPVENCRAVRIQAGQYDGLISANEQVGSRLVDGLFEKMKDAIAIGSEDHGLAVRRPGVGEISALVEAESLKRTKAAAGGLDPRNVYAARVGPTEKNQSFAISGNTGAH